MDDAKRYLEMLEALKQRAAKREDAARLEFLTLENLNLISSEVLAITTVALVVSVFVFGFYFRRSAQTRLAKVRKTFFIPRHWTGIASGICCWQSMHSLTTVLILMKSASVAGDASGERAITPLLPHMDLFTLVAYAANTFFIMGFAITLGMHVDIGYSVLCCVCALIVSFVQAASATDSLAVAGYVGLVNVLIALYWGVGIGKAWFKAELTQAMKEMEGLGPAKDEKDSSARGSVRRGGAPRRPPSRQ